MKKRLLSLLIAGVMTAGLLSGCGAAEDTQDQSDSTAQSDQSADETSSDTEANTEDTSDGGASDGKNAGGILFRNRKYRSSGKLHCRCYRRRFI